VSAPAPLVVGPGVRWLGAQRDVLGGDTRGHVDLAALAGAGPVWGLGPLEGVRGEVSIFGGEPSIARVERDAVVVTHGWQARACFLVWAQVPRWEERRPAHAGRDRASLDHRASLDLASLEREVVAFARTVGLDTERPLPFRAEGVAASLTLHVLDKQDDLPHDPERHERAKVRVSLEGRPVELVGFYSRHHRGVFTPREADVHVHVRTEDGGISGHLEAITLEPGARLSVPASGFHQ